MIPPLNQAGVLPPYLTNIGPTKSDAMSPYKTNIKELVSRFAVTPKRIDIVKGLINYRQLLRKEGIVDGFQWIDGSYVERCEERLNRSPNDVDVVTFAYRPQNYKDDGKWGLFVKQKEDIIFNRRIIKQLYACDAFYEDLSLPGKVIVSRARFWFGLFSHQRSTFLWKGLLEIPLQADDNDALTPLNGGTKNAS